VSLGCRDRGDGIRACTGANVVMGAFGQIGELCAGRSEANMCGVGMQCRDRGDKVFACAVSPAGSGQSGDLCKPTNPNFCSVGLECRLGQCLPTSVH